MDNENLVFSGRILDNVHGFIYYTKAEEKIINTELFKRLQSIKQLSIVNWVFPGSEHTRYIHSLGVMYIADKIAVQLKLSKEKRKLIRLAGLLHDIGHYPLSHVCEMPYKENISNFPDDDYCKKINFYLPVVFDPDEAFGLDVCGEHNDDYINLYLDWYPADKHIELTVSYIGRNCDECFKVNLTDKQYQRLAERLPEICKDAYGKTPEEICEETEKFLSVTLPVPSADYIPELIEET